MADNENYIENIQFGEDEEIYPIRDAEAHEEIDTNKEEIDNEIEQIKEDYVEKDGGELADTIVTYEDEETTVSSFTDFISNFISGSKVAKWFKDFRAGVEYILHVGSLVNNCVTDNAELPLSAAQGKVLMDELTSVKSDLTELNESLFDIQIGEVPRNGTVIAANSITEFPITFSRAFSSTPRIFLTSVSGTGNTNYGQVLFTLFDDTSSGFTCRVVNSSSSEFAPAIYYLAIASK